MFSDASDECHFATKSIHHNMNSDMWYKEIKSEIVSDG
jgi:hypothetical protein